MRRWRMPFPGSCLRGDRQLVQLQVEDGEDQDAWKRKPKVGTVYIIARPLEKKAAAAGSPLILTAYGKLVPQTLGHAHRFEFEFPDDNPKHKAMDYVLRGSGGKSSSGNFFASLALRKGLSGKVSIMWRMAHDPVRHTLTARKPFLVVDSKIALAAGVPLRVAWPSAQAAASALSETIEEGA